MSILKSKMIEWCYVIVIGLMIFVPLIHGSPEIWPDTEKYLKFDSSRPLLYPLFLWLFHLFGEHQFTIVMWVQSGINFLVLLYVNQWLQKRLQIPAFLTFLISFVTVILFFNHFIMLKSIVTEAIAFPLFILSVTSLVDNFEKFDLKKYVTLLLLVSLLNFAREQFYYFYILSFLVIAWHFSRQWSFKIVLQGLVLLVSAIFLTIFSTKFYQYSINHQFRGSSHAGELFISQMLYLSKPEDAKLFTNPVEKAAFEKMITKLQQLNITKQTAYGLHPPLTLDAAYAHFNRVVIDIETEAKLNLPASLNQYEANDMLLNISKILFLNSMKINLVFYAWKASSFVGGIWIFIAILMIVFAIVCRALFDRKWNPNLDQAFIASALMTIIANAIFVSIVAHYEARYFYYSYFLYFILATLVAKAFMKTRNSN